MWWTLGTRCGVSMVGRGPVSALPPMGEERCDGVSPAMCKRMRMSCLIDVAAEPGIRGPCGQHAHRVRRVVLAVAEDCSYEGRKPLSYAKWHQASKVNNIRVALHFVLKPVPRPMARVYLSCSLHPTTLVKDGVDPCALAAREALSEKRDGNTRANQSLERPCSGVPPL